MPRGVRSLLLPPPQNSRRGQEEAAAPRMHRPHGLSVPPPPKNSAGKISPGGQYHFTVEEGDGDRVFIAAEPAGDVIEKIRGDLLAFALQPGAMREEAQLVAEMPNRHIASISLTIVP
jgi:catechol 2,3-dioxygenase-like lactoylglutathione lyase family enzyme